MVERDKKRLLMLCYHYLPAVSGGVARSARFARHLSEYGWMPVVVTTSRWGEGGGTGETIVRVRELLRRGGSAAADRAGSGASGRASGASTRAGLRRALIRFAEKWLLIPDKHVRWATMAFFPALGALRRGRAEAIYTTSPPASAHVLGFTLKGFARRPWIMDLRDPWTLEPLGWCLRGGGARLSLEKWIERLCFRHADAIVTSTPEAAARYGEIYPGCARKIQAIPNGYDADEIEAARRSISRSDILKGIGENVFVMSHVGTFCRHTDLPAYPKGLLDAIRGLAREGAISAGAFRIVFAGGMNPETERLIARYDLGGLISTTGPVAHVDALRIMLRSDLLLLYDPNREARYYVHGKLYEYLASGRRILGVVPDGAARRLLESSGRAIAITADDDREIRPVLLEALAGRGGAAARAGFDVTRYEGARLTSMLARVLEKVRDG
jgi:glycosyltransferase involved in cell wall biosynthesis